MINGDKKNIHSIKYNDTPPPTPHKASSDSTSTTQRQAPTLGVKKNRVSAQFTLPAIPYTPPFNVCTATKQSGHAAIKSNPQTTTQPILSKAHHTKTTSSINPLNNILFDAPPRELKFPKLYIHTTAHKRTERAKGNKPYAQNIEELGLDGNHGDGIGPPEGKIKTFLETLPHKIPLRANDGSIEIRREKVERAFPNHVFVAKTSKVANIVRVEATGPDIAVISGNSPQPDNNYMRGGLQLGDAGFFYRTKEDEPVIPPLKDFDGNISKPYCFRFPMDDETKEAFKEYMEMLNPGIEIENPENLLKEKFARQFPLNAIDRQENSGYESPYEEVDLGENDDTLPNNVQIDTNDDDPISFFWKWED
jgi:hypothetical protein